MFSKIKNIILTTNSNSRYYSFYRYTYNNIKHKLGLDVHLGYITEGLKKDNQIIHDLKKVGGEIVIFDSIPDVPTGNQAKITRMYMASNMNCYFMLMDIDQWIINEDKLKDLINKGEPDKIGAIGANVYAGSKDENKWPMYFTFGRGNIIKEIINPEDLSYTDLVESWKRNLYRNNENPCNPPSNFSDESLLSSLIKSEKKEAMVVHIPRPSNLVYSIADRIDRSNWPKQDWWNKDNSKRSDGYYLDCFPVRPGEGHSWAHKIRPAAECKDLDLGLTQEPLLTTTSSHLPILQKIIETFSIKSVFEYGIGTYSTKLFLDKCDKVVSVEMNNHRRKNLSWYEYAVKELSNKSTKDIWSHKQLIGSSPAIHHSLGIFENEKFDMIFVDGHGDTRGEQVNAALTGSDIIVAHDTEHKKQRNKWTIPDGYQVIDFDGIGPITTVITTNEKAEAVKSWDNICSNVSVYLI